MRETPIYEDLISTFVMNTDGYQVHLRKATNADLSTLTRWHEQPHLLEAGVGNDWNWNEELLHDHPWRELLIAEVNGKPGGFVQIIDPAEEETHYWGQVEPNLRAIDIWIGEKELLGKGLGTEIMKLAIERCFADRSVQGILLDPVVDNHKAHRFYERLGFVRVEERFFNDDRCYVYRLDRHLWKK
jgi:aminoglycoside 6'-N-acetyltransferase